MTDQNTKCSAKKKNAGTRMAALHCLMRILEKGEYSHIVLREELKAFEDRDRQERAFLTRLTEGCVEHLYELDHVIDQFSKTPVKKMKPQIRNILRLSTYQLLYMDSVPDRAVCNEAVKLTVARGLGGLKGFVNGVLRNMARQRDAISFPTREDGFLPYAVIHYSMPEWMIRRLLAEYGEEQTEEILKNGISERPITVRCNLSRTLPEQVRTLLEAEDVKVHPVEGMEAAFEISGFDQLTQLTAWKEGLIQVQDVSSMLAGLLTAPKAGDKIVDVCAAPGGKSLHAADLLLQAEQKMPGVAKGSVRSRDISEEKISLIRENAARCKLSNTTAEVWDASEEDPDLLEQADIVIADLPCSGMGIIGRKGDIKYKMTEQAQADLVQLQRKLLNTIWKYVKPGGRLIFSTCTIFPEENRENAAWFAQNYPFEPEDLTGYLPKRFLEDTVHKGYLQLLPGKNNTDGFFLSAFRRV